ncbi:MAG: prepilin-type N-terminal cleavage/methylation domain-containing protein [Pseudomonadota bacterium]
MRQFGASRRVAGGFTLLEAIVAMVVFSLGAFALYGWLSTNTITLQRISDRRSVAEVRLSALDMMHGVNPMTQPSGRRALDGLQVQWRAVPLEPPKASVTQVGFPNLFQVGLYQVDVRVLQGSRAVDRFTLRQLGYLQTGKMEAD